VKIDLVPSKGENANFILVKKNLDRHAIDYNLGIIDEFLVIT